MNTWRYIRDHAGDLPPELLRILIEDQAQAIDRVRERRLLQELIAKYADAEKRLAELHRAKNRFLAIAAHDLRSPLSSIRGLGEILAESETDPDRRQSLETLAQTARDLITLINDLLDYAAIESGHFKLTRLPANLKQIIERRIWIHRNQARTKRIDLVADLRDVPPISADQDRLGQVVDNLVGNAIKFSPTGSTIWLRLEHDHQSVQFEVLDQGPGLTVADLQLLFREFQKLSAQPTGGEKSTGLGLAIVKRIVEAHQGSLEAMNGPSGGALFRCRFPIPAPPGETPDSTAA